MNTKPAYWFPAKTYGWGWGIPCTWQGWVVLLGYILGITLIAIVWNPVGYPALYYTSVILLTVLLIVICWLKGEKPSWRWGKDPEQNDAS